MVREILLATDFSPCSEAAARVAFDYSRQFGARLHVLHAASGPDGTVAALIELDRLVAGVPPRVEVVPTVEHGAAAGCVLRYLHRHDIDLVVMGSHGRTGVTRALLGSVSERVSRCAPCPVLTVPAGAGERPHADPDAAPPPLRRCLVCTAASEDLICGACRARIRGEALEHKLTTEKRGRV